MLYLSKKFFEVKEMAFDGITIRSLIFELNNKILNGRIDKIAQPEKDELLLTIKTPSGQQRLMLSVNASLPLAYLVSSNIPLPLLHLTSVCF